MISEFFVHQPDFKAKIAFPGPPFGPPFELSQISLEQKIKVIAVLDILLAVFKIFSLYIAENRDFLLYHVKF